MTKTAFNNRVFDLQTALLDKFLRKPVDSLYVFIHAYVYLFEKVFFQYYNL